MNNQTIILIRGAGDLASGIALRLWRAGMGVVMTEIPRPTAIRRTVAFSQAVFDGETRVEDVTAKLANGPEAALALLGAGVLPLLVDPDCRCREAIQPDGLVDAILAKRNLGTTIHDAPVVVGVGPGFTAGIDCHAAVETMRGHSLGRVLYTGSPLPNTNVPGLIGGFAGERVLRAPADGIFRAALRIGDRVRAGDVAGWVGDEPMVCTLDGILRGLLASGIPVHRGMKAGDVDPRGDPAYCQTASDKALAIGGGVLEAILHFRARQRRGKEERAWTKISD